MKRDPNEVADSLLAVADRFDAEAAKTANPVLDEIGPTKANKLRSIAAGLRTYAEEVRQPFPPRPRRWG